MPTRASAQDQQARTALCSAPLRYALRLRAPLHAPLRATHTRSARCAPLARWPALCAPLAQRNAMLPRQCNRLRTTTTPPPGPANEHPTPTPGSFVGHAPPSVRRCLRGDDGDGARRRADDDDAENHLGSIRDEHCNCSLISRSLSGGASSRNADADRAKQPARRMRMNLRDTGRARPYVRGLSTKSSDEDHRN